MLNDKQRETVRDYFRRNPNATPQDIERLLGFEMDFLTILETGLLWSEVIVKGGGSETGSVSGRVEIGFSMSGNNDEHNLTYMIAVKLEQASKQDVATKLRACILKKVMLALREEFSGILQDGDKMQLMISDAGAEIEKELRAFAGKEGAK